VRFRVQGSERVAWGFAWNTTPFLLAAFSISLRSLRRAGDRDQRRVRATYTHVDARAWGRARYLYSFLAEVEGRRGIL